MIVRPNLAGFDNLKTKSVEKFRGDIAKQLGLVMADLRRKDEAITESDTWRALSDLKMKIFDGSESLQEILGKCADMKIDATPERVAYIQELLARMASIAGEEKYNKLFRIDALQHPTKGAAVTRSGMFSASANEAEVESDSPVKKRLKHQVDSIQTPTVDAKEVVRVLMKEAAPKGYCGYLLDLHDEVTTKVDESGLSALPRDERLAERERRGNILLAEKMDKLIADCDDQGIKRLQVILVSGIHYTPCDIDVVNRSCVIFDASQDMRRMSLCNAAKLCKNLDSDSVIDTQSAGFVMQGRVINGGELQKSGYGCWVFSLQQSFAAAELESFHKNMKAAATIHDKTKLHTVSWLAYPPRMVYLAQSATFIEYYMQSRPYNRDEVMKLTNNNVAGYGFESAQAHFKKILAETFSRRKDHELEEALGEKSLIKPR